MTMKTASTEFNSQRHQDHRVRSFLPGSDTTAIVGKEESMWSDLEFIPELPKTPPFIPGEYKTLCIVGNFMNIYQVAM